jgi:hypothetical protein
VTRCAHCERVIRDGEEVVAFTVFVWNTADPLSRFNDSVFHATCLSNEPLGAAALARQLETIERLGPASHRCAVCGEKIVRWDDNITIPYLSAAADDLKEFDYLQFHRACLARWDGLTLALDRITRRKADGTIAGDRVERLLGELRQALAE